MALIPHQIIRLTGTTVTATAASASGDSCQIEPGTFIEITNTSGAARTVTFDGDPAGWIVREVFPNGDLAPHWQQGWDTAPTKWDRISIVDGHITIADPDTGPIGTNPAYDPDNPNSGARACMFRDFGPGYDDDIEVSVVWTCRRPAEATPLVHVDLATTEGGIGVWPGNDLFPEVPGDQAVFLFGVVGTNPDDFVVDSAELMGSDYPDNIPVTLTVRSSGGVATAYANGVQICDPMTVPAALVGSTSHGVALDYNQLDGNAGVGGPRTPNWPGCRAPFTITKHPASPDSADWSVPVADGATVRVGPVTAARFSRSAGVASWRYDNHAGLEVAAVRIPRKALPGL